jgi:lysozyme
VAPVTAAEIPAIRAALARMGYAVGPDATVIVASAVRAFQRDHALTEDGVIGRATAAMLERVLAARRKAAAPAVLGAAAAAEAVPAGAGGLGSIEAMTGLPWAAEIAAALAIGRAIWLGWAYRDALAPLFDRSLPRLAAFLRSF